MLRRLLLILAAAAALTATGCGNHEDVTTEADTEGIWLDVGPLDYHVQASRALNQYEVPDDRYLAGLPTDVASPKADELWFAVFLRIENKTDADALTAEEFEIEDTKGNKYTPVDINTQLNPFAYKATTLGPDEVVPHPDSPQEFDSTAGAELLFKIPLVNYANRPLEFKITGPDGTQAELSLDV